MNIVSCVLAGDTHVGKTCLVKSYISDLTSVVATVNLDFKDKITKTKSGESIKICIYDTAGHERFRTMRQSYYNKGDFIILMYDITNSKSFQSLDSWLKEIKNYARENVPIILVGNKLDEWQDRKVSKEEGEQFAKKHKLYFYQTSAKDNINVHGVFENHLDNFIGLSRKYTIKIKDVQEKKEEKCCNK